MAWLMFKDSGSHQYRGKKCDGFANKVKPQINLSWGMDHIDTFHRQQHPKQTVNTQNLNQKYSKTKIIPGLYEKKSDQQELQKIMKKYESKKIGLNKQTKLMDINDRQYISQRRQKIIHRSDTQQSSQKIRNIQTSLLPTTQAQPFRRVDTMGFIINQDRQAYNMSQSRVSRRSISGNKKNESRIVFGDGSYTEFTHQPEKKKDFHQQLLEMYDYQQKRNNRFVSQVFK